MEDIKEKGKLAIAGALIGCISVILVVMGNPGNMGFCIACFIRDISGALHLHQAAIVQYVRPEIIGIVLGSFAISVIKGDFHPRAGSSPFLRFIIGFLVMVGALIFLGCPLRMVLRLAGGDLNAIFALLGFIAGIAVGVVFLKNGFSLGRNYRSPALDGSFFTLSNILLLVLFVSVPSIFLFSESGPGSMHAPVFMALLAGLIVGIFAERTRLCMAGGIRDIFLIKDYTLITGFVAIFIFALIGNLLAGSFNLGFENQPVAHQANFWSFLGMMSVGLGSVMLGGCPLRQLVLAGEGSSDSALSCLGMLLGAAFAHNFGLASSAGTGPSANGKIAAVAALLILFLIGLTLTLKGRRN